MKFGICTSVDNLGLLEKLGYDYIEPTIQSIAFLTDEEYKDIRERVAASPLKCEAFNVLLPGTLKVVGKEVDLEALREYLTKAFSRAAGLGGKVAVFGSGGARKRPENVTPEEAFRQITAAAKVMAECAAPFGLTVVSEPLNKGETNTINSVPEGYRLAEAVDHPNFQILADIYHMALEGEVPKVLVSCGDRLCHVHIANPTGRTYPLREDEFDYAGYCNALKSAGYDQRISVEAGTEDMERDGAAALALLKRLLGA